MVDNGKRDKKQIRAAGRVVQLAAILAVVIMIYIDVTSPESISDWLYGVMLGIAAGANPDDFAKFFSRGGGNK